VPRDTQFLPHPSNGGTRGYDIPFREFILERKLREERRAAAGEVAIDSSDDDDDDDDDDLSSSEEGEYEELVVFLCECCNRKYATRNAFMNHVNSKRHRRNVAPYEEAGLLVYSLEIRSTENEGERSSEDEPDSYSEDVDDVLVKPKAIGFSALALGDSSNDEDEDSVDAEASEDEVSDEDDVADSAEEEEEEEVNDEARQTRSFFAALGECENSGSESADDERSEERNSRSTACVPPLRVITAEELAAQAAAEEEAEDTYLEELIVLNQLRQAEIDGADDANTDLLISPPPAAAPLPFANEFDADLYPGINEARFALVRHRLQSKLAKKGIEPRASDDLAGRLLRNGLDPVALGRTLLQQVMAARMDNLQARLDAYIAYKNERRLLVREFGFANGNSKALASQYTYRLDPADNPRRRANVHHAGSHYHMASVSGRTKGTVAGLSSRRFVVVLRGVGRR
jgi:hypothetical protein